jgi:hypothetical protein
MPTARNTGIGRSTPSGCRGFIQFLLGNPLLLLSAGLGIALLLTGLALKGYKSRSEHWHTQYELVNTQFGAFRMQVAAEGEKAKAEAEAKEKRQQEVNREVNKSYESRIADLRRQYVRLRDSTPVRPDGSAVPLAACGPASPDGAAGQSVSLADYRALESRAAEDALKVVMWQSWAKSQNLAVE